MIDHLLIKIPTDTTDIMGHIQGVPYASEHSQLEVVTFVILIWNIYSTRFVSEHEFEFSQGVQSARAQRLDSNSGLSLIKTILA